MKKKPFHGHLTTILTNYSHKKNFFTQNSAANKLEIAKNKSKELYDRYVNAKTFKVGDYVYDVKDVRNKTEPNWDGPYEVTQVLVILT